MFVSMKFISLHDNDINIFCVHSFNSIAIGIVFWNSHFNAPFSQFQTGILDCVSYSFMLVYRIGICDVIIWKHSYMFILISNRKDATLVCWCFGENDGRSNCATDGLSVINFLSHEWFVLASLLLFLESEFLFSYSCHPILSVIHYRLGLDWFLSPYITKWLLCIVFLVYELS